MSTTTTGAATPDAATGDPATFVGVAPHWYVTNTGGVLVNGVLAAVTGRRTMKVLFWGAVAVHVGEAIYAYRAARRAGFTASAPRWALQTLAVGFPSLLALHEARSGPAQAAPDAARSK